MFLITVATVVIAHSSPIPNPDSPLPSQALVYFAEIGITQLTLPGPPLIFAPIYS